MSGGGVSLREFARLDGCSEALVRRAVGDGRLARRADGTIDVALVGSVWRLGRDRDLMCLASLASRLGVRIDVLRDALRGVQPEGTVDAYSVSTARRALGKTHV